jgi:hypothetical protein
MGERIGKAILEFPYISYHDGRSMATSKNASGWMIISSDYAHFYAPCSAAPATPCTSRVGSVLETNLGAQCTCHTSSFNY